MDRTAWNAPLHSWYIWWLLANGSLKELMKRFLEFQVGILAHNLHNNGWMLSPLRYKNLSWARLLDWVLQHKRGSLSKDGSNSNDDIRDLIGWERGKLISLHVQHALWYNSLMQSAKRQSEIFNNNKKKQQIFHSLHLLPQHFYQTICSVLCQQ